MLINVALLVPYIAVLSNPEGASPLWGLPMLAWGFWAFRKLARQLSLGFMHVPVSSGAYLLTVLFGTLMCAPFGIFVIPFWVLSDIRKMILSNK